MSVFIKIKCTCIRGFPGGSVGKESVYSAGDAGDMGSTPGSGRSPGEGHDNSLQYSSLKYPMDRGAWRATVHKVAKSQTRMSTQARIYIYIYCAKYIYIIFSTRLC